MAEWWSDKDTEIGDFECEDNYYRSIHARKVNDQWEYAIVHWHYGAASLMFSFKDGKAIVSSD